MCGSGSSIADWPAIVVPLQHMGAGAPHMTARESCHDFKMTACFWCILVQGRRDSFEQLLCCAVLLRAREVMTVVCYRPFLCTTTHFM